MEVSTLRGVQAIYSDVYADKNYPRCQSIFLVTLFLSDIVVNAILLRTCVLVAVKN